MSAMSKFKNHQNVRYLQALFFEQAGADKSKVVYTLKDDDHEGYPSLYRLYLAAGDITEYNFATAYLDGWEHWEMLCDCSWFKPYISRWRRELELKIRSEALAEIINESKSGSRNAFAAQKFLVTRGYSETAEKGRPSKQEVRDEAKRIANDHFRLREDLARLTDRQPQTLN